MSVSNNQREIYERFKDYVDNKLIKYIKDLHILNTKRAKLIKSILQHKDFLIKEKANIDILNRINIQVPLEVNLDKVKDYNIELYYNIRSLNYININKIPKIKYKIKLYNVLRSADYSSYLLMLRYYNFEIGNQVLKGNRCSLGKYLSTLEVVHVTCNILHKRDRINFWESLQLKKRLEDQEISTYSKDNPDGVKYFIYYNTDTYYWFKWTKLRVKNKNKRIYQFEPSYNMNGPDIITFKDTKPSKEELFNALYLGLSKKLSIIVKHYPEYLINCAKVNTKKIKKNDE